MGAEEGEPGVAGVFEAFLGGAGDPGRIDKKVVFEEPGEDARKNPGHGQLRDLAFPPGFEGGGGAAGGLGPGVFLGESVADIGSIGRRCPGAEVVLNGRDEPLEVGKESGAVDHVGAFVRERRLPIDSGSWRQSRTA